MSGHVWSSYIVVWYAASEGKVNQTKSDKSRHIRHVRWIRWIVTLLMWMPMEDCTMNIKVVANFWVDSSKCSKMPSSFKSTLHQMNGGTSHSTALYTITFDCCLRVWQHTSLYMQSSTYYTAYVMQCRACIVMLMHAQQVPLLQSTTSLEANYIHCTTLQSACWWHINT